MPRVQSLSGDDLILVTGGAGFIGSHIARHLAELGLRVVISDRFGSGDKWRNIASARLYDLVRPDMLSQWLERHSGKLVAIVHMAAISSTTETDIDRFVANNIRLTLDLWEWCAANAIRFVYASSAATYGDGSAGFSDNQSPAALAALRPLNAYGWSKHVVDRRVAEDVLLGRPCPPQWAGLKFFNVYGPNETHKGDMQSLVGKFCPIIEAGGAVTLFKSHKPAYRDGGQLRDFVYIKDCVAVVEWLLQNPNGNGSVQCRKRRRTELSRPRRCGRRGSRTLAKSAVRRHSCRVARQVPVLHPGRYLETARCRIRPTVSLSGGGCPGFCSIVAGQ